MSTIATRLFKRLTELDSSPINSFTLQSSVAESDVQSWFDSVDVADLKTTVDNQISRTIITDLEADAGIGDDNLCVCDVIESHNDDPDDYEAAYLIRADRTFVQYKKRGVAGNQPISEANVQAELDDHVSEMVDRAVNGELLNRAKTEFGV